MSKKIHVVNKKDGNQAILRRGVVEIIDANHLATELQGGKKLRVKFGVDPTAPDIHLGHTIPLLKIRQFQDMGHTGVIIIGDYTASIGDPSGKDNTRPSLSLAQVKKNSAQYKKQILKILRLDRTEFHFQSEWFKKFRLHDILSLASRVSVSQLLAHETFRSRLEKEKPFMLHEMWYPLLQGYDSVAVRADVEVGGMDQKFNLLMGRVLQKQQGMDPQDILMTSYLMGTDGVNKMSKSLNNYIGINDTPDTMYGKIMTIPDGLIISYFELLTAISEETLEQKKQTVKENPLAMKKELAETITTFYWGKTRGQRAEQNFRKTFQEHAFSLEVPVVTISARLHSPLDVLVAAGLAQSKSEAKRLIGQKGVFINDVCLLDWQTPLTLQEGMQVRVGKRKAVTIHLI